MDSSSLKELMDRLEKEGVKKVEQLKTESKPDEKMMQTLVDIMKDGEKEFIKKTGRRMTYSEMRQMYG